VQSGVFIKDNILHVVGRKDAITIIRVSFFILFICFWTIGSSLGLYNAIFLSRSFIDVFLILVFSGPIYFIITIIILANTFGKELIFIDNSILTIVDSMPGYKKRKDINIMDIVNTNLVNKPRIGTMEPMLAAFGLFKSIEIQHGNVTTRIGRNTGDDDADIIISFVNRCRCL